MTDYSRMPGMGDLPGDSSHPNSPDHDDSAYWEAAEAVGQRMPRCDVVELVEHLVAAENALALIAAGKTVDVFGRQAISQLREHASGLASDITAAMRDAA